jgi:hypothetical protein
MPALQRNPDGSLVLLLLMLNAATEGTSPGGPR